MNQRIKTPKADHRGILYVGDIEIPCYVLDDGRRVVGGNAAAVALGLGDKSTSRDVVRTAQSKSLKPLLSAAILGTAVIKFRVNQPGGNGSSVAHGFDSEFLNATCDAILEARYLGILHSSQEHLAPAAERLMRAFARVGLVALIDEATGFQKTREDRALQGFLDQFLADEARAWGKVFPDALRDEIYRLKGWDTTKQIRAIGYVYRDVIYSRILPEEGIDKIEELNPSYADAAGRQCRKDKWHQWLSEDMGAHALQCQLQCILALARGFQTYDGFLRAVDRSFPKKQAQHQLFDPQV